MHSATRGNGVLLGELEQAMIAFHSAYGSIGSNELHDEGDCTWYRSSIPFPVYGGAISVRFSAEAADERIPQVREALKAAGAPSAWWVTPSSSPADIDKRLAAAGAEQVVELQGMGAPLDAVAPPPPMPPGVEIRRADTEELVREYARLYPILFGAPTEDWIDALIDIEVALFRSGSDPFNRWLALENGQPVSAGATSTAGKTAFLQTLCTLPEHRNRGIGAALMCRAFDADRKNGCVLAGIWAGPGADKMYMRQGFERIGTARVFAFTA
jgi:GNAT superfamily N-acetyltransferase